MSYAQFETSDGRWIGWEEATEEERAQWDAWTKASHAAGAVFVQALRDVGLTETQAALLIDGLRAVVDRKVDEARELNRMARQETIDRGYGVMEILAYELGSLRWLAGRVDQIAVVKGGRS